jgi:hypothetical protein
LRSQRRAIGASAIIAMAVIIVVLAMVDFVMVTSTTESTEIETLTSSSSDSIQPELYNVTFQQVLGPACSPGAAQQSYATPWSVTIGNDTVVQPPGTPVPITQIGQTMNTTLAKISFLLPAGSYRYEIQPSGAFPTNSGVVVVNGTGVVVMDVPAPVWPCMSTATVTTLTSASSNTSES